MAFLNCMRCKLTWSPGEFTSDMPPCPNCRVSTLEARIAELERERDELRRQLTFQRDTNHARNVEMDALHYVWCNGGCKGGVHRFTPGELTEEIVAAAERNTKRMRHWLANHLALLAIHPAQPETPAAPGPYSGT